MSIEVHIDWAGETLLAGRLFPAERGNTVSFEYAREWLPRPDGFALDPTSLPLRPGMQHSGTLFGGIQDCGPDRWGRLLIERAERRKVLEQKPFREEIAPPPRARFFQPGRGSVKALETALFGIAPWERGLKPSSKLSIAL